jgi:hypothetical protein
MEKNLEIVETIAKGGLGGRTVRVVDGVIEKSLMMRGSIADTHLLAVPETGVRLTKG